uniref:Uncharacterized protein n=1 Tax=Arundo donax TaxID=35708 RepID=A0A0A9H3K5_ARUDO
MGETLLTCGPDGKLINCSLCQLYVTEQKHLQHDIYGVFGSWDKVGRDGANPLLVVFGLDIGGMEPSLGGEYSLMGRAGPLQICRTSSSHLGQRLRGRGRKRRNSRAKRQC